MVLCDMQILSNKSKNLKKTKNTKQADRGEDHEFNWLKNVKKRTCFEIPD